MPERNHQPNTESNPKPNEQPIPIDTLKAQLPHPQGPAPRAAQPPKTPKPAKPRSPAQIEASRRNGAKSRGPKTPTGKAISSRNRTTHGFRAARNPCLPSWEDSAAFQRHLEEYLKSFLPQDRAQYECVHDIALADWQSRHVHTLNARAIEILAASRGPGVDPDTALAHSLLQSVPPGLRHYLSCLRRLDTARSRYQRDCLALQNHRAKAGSGMQNSTFEPEPPSQPLENAPPPATDNSVIAFEPGAAPSQPLTNNREPAGAGKHRI